MPDIQSNPYNYNQELQDTGVINTQSPSIASAEGAGAENATPTPPNIFNIMNNSDALVKAQNPWMKSEQYNTPINTKLSDTERYADPQYGFSPYNENTENQYGDRQSWYKDLGKTIVKTGANVIAGFAQTIATIPNAVNAAVSGDLSKLEDNPVNNTVGDMLQSLDTYMPQFQTTFEKNHPVLNYIPFVGNGWGKVMQNVGFVGGAIGGTILQDAAIGAMTGGVGDVPVIGAQLAEWSTKIGKMFSGGDKAYQGFLDAYNAGNQTEKALDAASAYSKIVNGTRYVLSVQTAAWSQAAMMANSTHKMLRTELQQDYYDKHGYDATGLDNQKVEDYARDGANTQMLATGALLSVTDAIQFPSLLKPFQAAKRGVEATLDNGVKIGLEDGVWKAIVDPAKGLKGLVSKALPSSGLVTSIGTQTAQMAGMMLFGNTAEDFYKRKFDDSTISDLDNLNKSTSEGLQKVFFTRNGMEGVLMGGLIGIAIHGLRGAAERVRGLPNSKDAITNTTLGLLNSTTLTGTLENHYDEAATTVSIQKDMKAAIESGDLFEYKNLQQQQLYNLVTSGVKANRFEARIEQLKMLKELSPDEFKSMFQMDFNDGTKATANEYVDALIDKAYKIRDIVKKVDRVFQNPYDFKSTDPKEQDNYKAFEYYKDQLGMNLSARDDNKARIAQLGLEIGKVAPEVNLDKLVNLTSEDGVNQTIKDFQDRLKELNKDQELGIPSKREAHFLESKIAALQSDLKDFQPARYMKTLHDTVGYLSGGIDVTAQPKENLISPIDLPSVLQKAQDIYKLGENSKRVDAHYETLTSKKGYDSFINDIISKFNAAGANITVDKDGNIKDERTVVPDGTVEDVSDLDENGNPIEPQVVPEPQEAQPIEDIVAKEKEKTILAHIAKSKSKKDLKSNPEAVDYVKNVLKAEPDKNSLKMIKEAAKNKQKDLQDAQDVEDAKASGIELSTGNETPKVAKSTVQKAKDAIKSSSDAAIKKAKVLASKVYDTLNPQNFLNRVNSRTYEDTPRYDDNLRNALFNGKPEDLQNSTLKVSKNTHHAPEKVSGLNVPGLENVVRKTSDINIEMSIDGKPIGKLADANSLFFKRDGALVPLSEITKEEYPKITGNSASTYVPFIKELNGYKAIYDKLRAEYDGGKTEFTPEDTKALFDVLPNYGNAVYTDNISSATPLKNIKTRNSGDVILSVPTEFDNASKSYIRVTTPTILGVKELSPENFQAFQKFLTNDVIEHIRKLNSRYIYVNQLPNGKYDVKGIFAARPAKVKQEVLDNIVNTLTHLPEKINKEDLTKLNKTLRDELYIADSANDKGTKTNIKLSVNEDGRVDLNLLNKAKLNPNNDKKIPSGVRIEFSRQELSEAKNIEGLVNIFNHRLAEKKYQKPGLSRLNIVISKDDFKTSILQDDEPGLTNEVLNNSLTVATDPLPYINPSVKIMPKGYESNDETGTPKAEKTFNVNKMIAKLKQPFKTEYNGEALTDQQIRRLQASKPVFDVNGKLDAQYLAETLRITLPGAAKIADVLGNIKDEESLKSNPRTQTLTPKEHEIIDEIESSDEVSDRIKAMAEADPKGTIKHLQQQEAELATENKPAATETSKVIESAPQPKEGDKVTANGTEWTYQSSSTVSKKGEKAEPTWQFKDSKGNWQNAGKSDLVKINEVLQPKTTLDNKENVSTQKTKNELTNNKTNIPLSDFSLHNEDGLEFTKRVKTDEGGVSGVQPLNQFKLNQGINKNGDPYPKVHIILDDADALKYQEGFTGADGKKKYNNTEFRNKYNDTAKKYRDTYNEIVLDFRKSEVEKQKLYEVSKKEETPTKTEEKSYLPEKIKTETVKPSNPIHVKDIPLSDISLDDNVRKKVEQHIDKGVSSKMNDAPIVLKYNNDGSLEVLDGAHRFIQAERGGKKNIDSQVINVEQDYETFKPATPTKTEEQPVAEAPKSTLPESLVAKLAEAKKIAEPLKIEETTTHIPEGAITYNQNDGFAPVSILVDNDIKNNYDFESENERIKNNEFDSYDYLRSFAYENRRRDPITIDLKGLTEEEIQDKIKYFKYENKVKAKSDFGESAAKKMLQESNVENRWMHPIPADSYSLYGHLSDIQKAFINHDYDKLISEGKMTEKQLRDIVASTKRVTTDPLGRVVNTESGLNPGLVDKVMFRTNHPELLSDAEYWKTLPNKDAKGDLPSDYIRTISEVVKNGDMMKALESGILSPEDARKILDSTKGIRGVATFSGAIDAKLEEEADQKKELKTTEKLAAKEGSQAAPIEIKSEGIDAVLPKKTYSIGISNATTSEVDKAIGDKLEKARQLEKAGKTVEAKKIYDDVLKDAKKRLADKFADLKEITVETKETQGNFFEETEPTLETTIKDEDSHEKEIIKRIAELGEDFKQDAVHVSEMFDTLPEGSNFGEQAEDGSVLEPNLNLRFDRKLSAKEVEDLNKEIQAQGLAGATLHADNKGFTLYNISNFKPYEEFIDQTGKLIELLQSRGVQLEVGQNVRKLWNIGKSSGEGFVSYDEAKGIPSEVPEKVIPQEEYKVQDVTWSKRPHFNVLDKNGEIVDTFEVKADNPEDIQKAKEAAEAKANFQNKLEEKNNKLSQKEPIVTTKVEEKPAEVVKKKSISAKMSEAVKKLIPSYINGEDGYSLYQAADKIDSLFEKNEQGIKDNFPDEYKKMQDILDKRDNITARKVSVDVRDMPDAVDTVEKGTTVVYNGQEVTVDDVEKVGDNTYYLIGDHFVKPEDVTLPEKDSDLLESYNQAIDNAAAEKVFKTDESGTPYYDQLISEDSPEEDADRFTYVGLHTVLERLKNKFGLNYKVVDAEGNWRGRFKDGQVLINLKNVNKDTPFHEYLHPFIETAKTGNPELYNKLHELLAEDPEGQTELKLAKLFYKNDTEQEQKDEALVTYLSKKMSDSYSPSTGKRIESTFFEKMKDLLGKFRTWMNKVIWGISTDKEKGIEVSVVKGMKVSDFSKVGKYRPNVGKGEKIKPEITNFIEQMTLGDFANFVGLSDVKFDLSNNLDVINNMDRLQKATFDPETEDGKILNGIERKLKVLEKTANVRRPSEELRSEVGSVKGILTQAQADEGLSINNYVKQGINAISFANDEFGRIQNTLHNPDAKFSQKDVSDLNRRLQVVNDLYSFYDNVEPLFRRIVKGLDDADYRDMGEVLRKNSVKKDQMRSTMADLTSKWLYPYIEQANKFVSEENKKLFPHLLVQSEDDFRRKLLTADADPHTLNYLFGSIGSSKDPVNAIVKTALIDILRRNNETSNRVSEDMQTEYHNFLKRTGLKNDRKTTSDYYKNNYMRHAEQWEKIGEDKDGLPEYGYVKRLAFHEEFNQDQFEKDKRTFIASLGEEPDAGDRPKHDAWFDKIANWEDKNMTLRKTGKQLEILDNEGKGTGKFHDLDEHVPSDKYKNANFDKLKSDPFYQKMYNQYKGDNSKVLENKLNYGIIPQISKGENSWTDLKWEYGLKKNAKTIAGKIANRFRGTDNSFALKTEDGEVHFGNDDVNLDGSVYKSIKHAYTRLLDEHDLDTVLVESVLKYHHASQMFSDLKESEPNIKALQDLVNGNKTLGIPGRDVNVRTANGNVIFDKVLGLPHVKEVQLRRLNVQLNSFIDDVVYGDSEFRDNLQLGNYTLSLNKLGSNLGLLTALNNMAFNLGGGIANILIGDYQSLQEGFGGKYYTKKEWLSAGGEYWGAVKNGDIFRDVTSVKKSPITQLIHMYDALQGEFRDKYGKNIVGSIGQRFSNLDSIFFMMHAGEHEIQSRLMLAMMRHQDVPTKSGAKLNLRDAYQPDKNGNLRLIDDAIWTESDKNNFMGRLHAKNYELNGNYSSIDKAMIQRKWYGKALLLYRKYLYNAFRARYSNSRMDYELRDVIRGNYNTFFMKLASDIKEYKFDAARRFLTRDGWSNEEKYAYNKTVFELGTAIGVTALCYAIQAGADKQDASWAHKAFYLRLLNLQNDLTQYTVFGLSDMVRIAHNPSAIMGTLGKYGDFFAQLTTDPTGVYQQKQGIFAKGYNKTAAKAMKALPIVRQVVNFVGPDNTIKFYEMNPTK